MEAGPYQSLSVPATLKVSEVSLTWAIKDVYFTKKKKKKNGVRNGYTASTFLWHDNNSAPLFRL